MLEQLRIYGAPANGLVLTGELFDLEALSRTCKELNRYSFFVTSMPLNSTYLFLFPSLS